MNKKERLRRKRLAEKASGIVDEFYKNAKPSNVFEKVREELIKELNSPKHQKREWERQKGIAEIMNWPVGI